VLLVNLLAALNFERFLKIKNVWKIEKKRLKNIKNVTKIKNVKKRFLHLWLIQSVSTSFFELSDL